MTCLMLTLNQKKCCNLTNQMKIKASPSKAANEKAKVLCN